MFLRKKDKFISLVLKHIGTSALMDLLLRLVSCVEPAGLRHEVLQVSLRPRLPRAPLLCAGSLALGGCLAPQLSAPSSWDGSWVLARARSRGQGWRLCLFCCPASPVYEQRAEIGFLTSAPPVAPLGSVRWPLCAQSGA